MSLQSETQQLLTKHKISPNNVLGQNFLVDPIVVEKLLSAASVTENDTVIEVGPGTGNITTELAKRVQKVLAVEKDPNMIKILHDKFTKVKNVEIVQMDILKFLPITHDKTADYTNQQLSSYKVLGAPPYYLTNRLFRKFLQEEQKKPDTLAVIIPKQIAQRAVAQPPHSNLLAISIQLYGEPKIVKDVPKSCFWPQPEVDSAILILKNIQKSNINEEIFFKIVRAGFSSPRKQLVVNLTKHLEVGRTKTENILKKASIDPSRRAQTLSVEEWKWLTIAFEAIVSNK